MRASELDLVHARIILVETLRGVGPGWTTLSDQLLEECYDLALGLSHGLDAELAARREGSGGEQSPQG